MDEMDYIKSGAAARDYIQDKVDDLQQELDKLEAQADPIKRRLRVLREALVAMYE